MADAYTPRLALIKPEVGASRDTWGTKWNQNADILDQFVSQFCVVGMIADFAGTSAPSGWLIADGRIVSRTTYSKLFAVIGTHWGSGDGSTTFALPNAIGRSGVGPGTATDVAGNTTLFAFGSYPGWLWRNILQSHLPNYTMTTSATGNHNHTGAVVAGGSHNHTTDPQGDHSHAGNTGTESVGHTHTGTTTGNGSHAHTVSLPNQGIGVTGGSVSVMSNFFGTTGYTTDTVPGHTHSFTTTGEDVAHVHAIVTDGGHIHTTTTAAEHTHAIQLDGDHAHFVSLGGGGVGLEIIQPVLVITKIIYAGSEAAIVTAADIATAPTSSDTHQEIENLREEIAALRSLFETPRARMLSAPSRGPH
jgi:microcystin-dependent protein